MSSGQNKEPTDPTPEPNPEGGPPVPHHISDVDTWGHPDRNYFVFVALSIFMGLIGADHFYLRSYDTAFKKLLLNVVGLGIWWFWDIIQIINEGAKVRREGLTSPLDWIRGIGRGMFVPLPADLKGGGSSKDANGNKKEGDGKEYAAPKSYVVYTLLAIVLGAVGADKFYIGQNGQGLAKLFSVFNIFLFLFGILWVLWDAFNAFFRTSAVLEEGIVAPIPFSWFFRDPVDAKALFLVQEIKGEEEAPKDEGGFLSKIPFLNLYQSLVVPLLQPTVGSGVQTVGKVSRVGTQGLSAVAGLASKGTGIVDQGAEAAGEKALEQARLAAQPQQPLLTQPQTVQGSQANRSSNVPNIAPPSPLPAQTGGGGSRGGPGPVIAGALTALLVAGGAKGLYDVLARQYS